MVECDMGEIGRHERAVARSLGFARDAAANGDLIDALEWARVVEVVEGGLSVEWQRARAGWVDRKRSAERVDEPAIAAREAAGAGNGA
jgi:hypothetical protein